MERFTLEHLPIDNIIVLPQIRKSFFGIKYLAQDIYRNGLLQNLVVCVLNEQEAKKYVSYIAQVHKKYLTLKKYGNQKKYIFLIAGERRIRALRLLNKQNKLVELFPNKKVPVSIRTNITAQNALRLQAAENKREDVNKAEEAEFYAQWFFAEKLMHEGKFSINKFSFIASRSPGAISRAIKFHTLPLDLKKNDRTRARIVHRRL